MEAPAIEKIKSLIQASELLTSAEKQEWLDLCDVMNDDQLEELNAILLSVLPKEKPKAPLPELKAEPKGLPLKHILNLPQKPNPEEVLVVNQSKPTSKFWQKIKSVLAEKELPPGHPESTKELELPEHANLPPTNLVKISKQPVLPAVVNKPPVKPVLTPKPPVPKKSAQEEHLSEVVRSAVKSALKETSVQTLKPVEKLQVEPLSKLEAEPAVAPVVKLPPKETKQSEVISDTPKAVVEAKPVNNSQAEAIKSVTPLKSNVSASAPTETILTMPKLETLKVDKIVVNEDTYNEKSSYKILNPEEIKKNILQNIPASLSEVEDKIVPEPKLENDSETITESLEIKQEKEKPQFVPGLANSNILAEAKLTPPEKMVKVKSLVSHLPIAQDFNNLDQVASLTQEALAKDLVPALKNLIVKSGFFDVYSALERSPLFGSYINTGLNMLAGKADFNNNKKPALNKEQFERFVDVLRGIKH
jgi:hypothetical protein